MVDQKVAKPEHSTFMESKLGNVSIMLEQDAGEETDNLEASIRRGV